MTRTVYFLLVFGETVVSREQLLKAAYVRNFQPLALENGRTKVLPQVTSYNP